MVPPHHTLYFYFLEALTLTIFVAGCGMRVVFWLCGVQDGTSLPRRAGRLLQEVFARLFAPEGLRAIFGGSLLQNRLRRTSLVRWNIHIFLFGGFLALFFIGSLGDWATDHEMWSVTKDTPWFAIVNELSGLLLLAGVLAVLVRKYAIAPKEPTGRSWRDAVIPVWLGLLAVTGYLAEGARLASDSGLETQHFSFVGWQFATLWQGAGLASTASFQANWWLHAVLSLGFVAYLPYSPLFHMLTAPLSLLLNSPRPRENEVSGTATQPHLDPALAAIAQRVQLEACTRCGECVRWCEASFVRPGQATSPSHRIEAYHRWALSEQMPPAFAWLMGGKPLHGDSLASFAEGVYQCTLCARCVEACPVKIDLLSLWVSLRSEMALRGLHPAGLGQIREAVVAEHNILNYPNADRDLWVDYVADAPEDRWQRDRAEVMYFVGCMSSFSPAAQDIPMAFAEVMLHAGVDFALLGGQEWCCGFPLHAAGMEASAMEALRRHNIERLTVLGAKTVVFNCPSCYQTWARFYRPHLPAGVELYHASQFLARLITEGKIRLSRLDQIVTYHDPCDLGRNCGVYEEPRAVLEALPGVEFREARWNREQAHCCGGGGDLEAADAELAHGIAARTFQTLADTNAETLAVACPQCKRMFQSAAKSAKSKMEVVDLVELVRRAMQEDRSPVLAESNRRQLRPE